MALDVRTHPVAQIAPAAALGAQRARSLPIADHGLIGDLHTVALVGTDGTIDWYCCPRFDSPSVFAAILDADQGGLLRISPACDGWSSEQLYLPDIGETRGGRRDHTYSRPMRWVALERAIRVARQRGLPADIPRRTAVRDRIYPLCSFWWVEALARAGRLDQARLAFEKMLTYANHAGLYSEEIRPAGEQLGNFPQAFTHLALISAAYSLDRRLG